MLLAPAMVRPATWRGLYCQQLPVANITRHTPLLSYCHKFEKKYSYMISRPILAKTKQKLTKYTYITLSQHNIAFIALHRHRSCQKEILPSLQHLGLESVRGSTETRINHKNIFSQHKVSQTEHKQAIYLY